MPLKPVRSLVAANDSDVDKRRAVADAVADTGVPSASTSWNNTRHHRYLHVSAVVTGGTSVDVTLYGKVDYSEVVSVLDWFETAGTVTIPTGSYISQPLEIDGIDEVYARVHNHAGGESVDLWLAGSSN